MVKEIKNKHFSFFLFSLMFSVLLFFILLSFLSDTIDDYTGSTVTDEVISVANYLVLIYTGGIFACVLLANLLSDVDLSIAILSSIISIILTIIILSAISYITLDALYGNVLFIDAAGRKLPFWNTEILLNFSVWNTLFAIHVVGDTNTYFLIVLVIMLSLSYIWTLIVGGFPKKKKEKKRSKYLDI